MQHFYCPFLEIKADPNDDDGTFTGYGSTFGNMDSYGDTVAPGAFAKTIADAKSGVAPWPAMLSQHGGTNATPIGIWTDMDEDDNGLKMTGKLAIKTKRGGEAYALLLLKPRPAFNGLSIGYRARDFELHRNRSGPNGAKRTLKSVDLVECSLVTFPADKFARVASVKTMLNGEQDELLPLLQLFRKANPNHGPDGRFSSGDGSSGGSHEHSERSGRAKALQVIIGALKGGAEGAEGGLLTAAACAAFGAGVAAFVEFGGADLVGKNIIALVGPHVLPDWAHEMLVDHHENFGKSIYTDTFDKMTDADKKRFCIDTLKDLSPEMLKQLGERIVEQVKEPVDDAAVRKQWAAEEWEAMRKLTNRAPRHRTVAGRIYAR